MWDDIFEGVVDFFTGDWGGVVENVVDIAQELDGDGGGGGAPPRSTAVTRFAGGGGNGALEGEYIQVAQGGAVRRGSVQPLIAREQAAVGGAGRIARWGRGLGAVLVGKGMQMRARDALEIVKRYGPEVAAGVLGWTVAELMSVLGNLGALTPKKRRRRGISARDVRTTKRVCGFVQSISRQLADCRPRSFGRGRKSGSAQFVRQG